MTDPHDEQNPAPPPSPEAAPVKKAADRLPAKKVAKAVKKTPVKKAAKKAPAKKAAKKVPAAKAPAAKKTPAALEAGATPPALEQAPAKAALTAGSPARSAVEPAATARTGGGVGIPMGVGLALAGLVALVMRRLRRH